MKVEIDLPEFEGYEPYEVLKNTTQHKPGVPYNTEVSFLYQQAKPKRWRAEDGKRYYFVVALVIDMKMA
jgi:hypothetical protein